MRYFDTGVLLKLYLPEPRAAEAITHVRSSAHPPPITRLHELELRSALRQKAGRGEISHAECTAVLAQMDADLAGRVLERVEVQWTDVFAIAESLSDKHGTGTLCRSLDTLHGALAMSLETAEFCTFDHRQSLMAAAAGLVLIS